MADAVRDAKLKLVLDSAEAVRGMADVKRAGEAIEQQQERVAAAAEKANAKLGGKDAAADAAQKAIERYGAAELSRPEMRRQRAQERRDAAYIAKFENEQEVMERASQRDAAKKATDAAAKAEEENRQRQATAFTASARNRLHDLGLIDNRTKYEKARDAEKEGGGIGGMLGGLGRFTPHALLATGVAAAGMSALSAGTTVAGALNNSQLTNAQKNEVILDRVTWGVAKRLRDFGEEVGIVVDRIRRSQIRLEQQTTLDQQVWSNYTQETQMRVGLLNAQSRAGILGGASMSQLDHFDRRTMASELGYREQQMRVPSQDAAEAAAREAAIARDEVGAAASAQGLADRNLADARRERQRRERANNRVMAGEASGTRDRAGRTETANELQIAQANERAALDEAIAARNRMRDAGVNAAQAEARAREANIAVMRTELDILRQREQRMMSDASRLGNMNALDRQMGLQAAIMAERQGIGSLTPEMRQRAAAFAPERFQQLAAQFGEGTAEYREGRRLGLLTPAGESIDQNRAEQTRLQQQIREQTLASQQALARETADILGATLQTLVTAFTERLRQLERELYRGQQQRNNANP